MWRNLPSDLLANIFSILSPDSLARAMTVCREWHKCAKCTPSRLRHPAWLLALPCRTRSSLFCYVHNPTLQTWHMLSLSFVPTPSKAIATINGLVLFKSTTIALQLSVCNPFTRQFKYLPLLCIARTNPAIGVVEVGSNHFMIYVAGGMSDASKAGGATYEPTVEMYDSQFDTWEIIGTMPVEIAVRLTVWSPNESVYSNGVLYWITSARAYSIMGFQVQTNRWRELSVPMGDTLEFASLIPRNGKLTLVGGSIDAWIWELGVEDDWCLVEKIDLDLKTRFLGGKESWGCTKCVGVEGEMCLYKESGLDMLAWRKVVGECSKWEWCWIKGCSSIKDKQVPKFSTKGLLIHPNLSSPVF
ncbi:hypothetical protein ACET3Z_026686 [Daucus carota]